MIDTYKAVAWFCGLLFALLAYTTWRTVERSIGARDVRIEQLTRRGDSLINVISADSARFAKRDTVKLFRTIATTDTVLRRLIDTSIVHRTDTVTVTRTLLVTVDSTLRACRETVSACAKLANDRGALLMTRDSTITLLQAKMPTVLSRCGLSIGYGVQAAEGGRISHGFAALAGCRVFP